MRYRPRFAVVADYRGGMPRELTATDNRAEAQSLADQFARVAYWWGRTPVMTHYVIDQYPLGRSF